MVSSTKRKTVGRADCFDCSAGARLQRMGLLNQDGSEDRSVIAVFTQIYAALLFDDLCDSLTDQMELKEIVSAFSELANRKDSKRIFLLLSFLYDRLKKPMPEPVWWLMSEASAMETFAFGFVELLVTMADDAEKEWKGGCSHEAADHCSG